MEKILCDVCSREAQGYRIETKTLTICRPKLISEYWDRWKDGPHWEMDLCSNCQDRVVKAIDRVLKKI